LIFTQNSKELGFSISLTQI